MWEKNLKERVDIYVGITDSLCCMPETNILNQLYSNKICLKKMVTPISTNYI